MEITPQEHITIGEALRNGKAYLKKFQIDTSALEAEILWMHVLNCGRIELILREQEPASLEFQQQYNHLLVERSKHVPIAYLLGKKEFMSREFIVTSDVLIPRPDTEILVEAALAHIQKTQRQQALELCTGSGCISIALACAAPNLHITATDSQKAALAIAYQNANRHAVSDKIQWIWHDVFQSWNPLACRHYDLIIANPPYIPSESIQSLDCDVKDYEPLAALDGGTDGLKFYRRIVMESRFFLQSTHEKKGALFLEIGYDQSEAVGKILVSNGFDQIQIYKDLAGHDRVIQGQLMD